MFVCLFFSILCSKYPLFTYVSCVFTYVSQFSFLICVDYAESDRLARRQNLIRSFALSWYILQNLMSRHLRKRSFEHIHINCRLFCHLLVILKVILTNSVDPDQTAPLFASMQK